MATKTFKRLLREARERDTYWSAKAKLDFVQELDELMKRRGVNRKDLATRFGVSAPYISKALRGDVNFTIESMARLAYVLNGRLDLHVRAVEDATIEVEIIQRHGELTSGLPCMNDSSFHPIGRTSVNEVVSEHWGEEDARATA